MKSNQTVNARQAAFIYFPVVTIEKFITIPPLLVEAAGRDSWFSLLLLLLLEGLLLLGFVWITARRPGIAVDTLLSRCVGRPIARMLTGVFGLFLLFRTYLMMFSVQLFLGVNLFDKLNWMPFAFPILLVLSYCAYKGLRAIGRMAEIIGMGIGLIVLGMVIALLTKADFSMFAPLFYDGMQPSFNGAEKLLFLGAGDSVIFYLLLGKVERPKIVRNMSVSYVLSALSVMGFLICFYGFYGDAGMHLKDGQAIGDMLQFLRGSDSLFRMDIFVVAALFILFLVKLVFYIWGTAAAFRITFKIPEKSKASAVVTLSILIVLCVAETVTQNYAAHLVDLLQEGFKYILVLPFEIVYPLLAVIGAAVDSVKRRAVYRRVARKGERI